jgi:hypothetical protein
MENRPQDLIRKIEEEEEEEEEDDFLSSWSKYPPQHFTFKHLQSTRMFFL